MRGRTSYRIRRSRNDTAKSVCYMDQIINEYAVGISSLKNTEYAVVELI